MLVLPLICFIVSFQPEFNFLLMTKGLLSFDAAKSVSNGQTYILEFFHGSVSTGTVLIYVHDKLDGTFFRVPCNSLAAFIPLES